MTLLTPSFQVTRKQTQLILIILTLFAGLGVLYLAPKVLTLDAGPNDYFEFRIFWLAGKIWASGQDPYVGASFPTEYFSPSDLARVSPWFYPPYWYPLIVPFGLLPFQTAFSIWKLIGFSLLIGANHLIARALADVTGQKYLPIFLAGTGFVCFMRATAVTVETGQTSILVYFGLSAMVFGLLKARPLALIVGLAFLALKPQIGLIAFVAVVCLHRYRWTILPPVASCLLGSFAIAITGDYRASVESFLANLARSSEHTANNPQYYTGLIYILNYVPSISNAPLTEPIVFLAAIISTVVVFYNSPLNNIEKIDDTQQAVANLALFLAIVFFLIPLHLYDPMALVALLMMIIAVPLAGRWLIALGLVICFRPDYLWHAFGIARPSDIQLSHVVSGGLLLIFVGAVWSVVYQTGRPNRIAIKHS